MTELPSWIATAHDPASADQAIRQLKALWFPQQSPVLGRCNHCDLDVTFETTSTDFAALNWRETVSCPSCALIMRWRAALHMFDAVVQPNAAAQIYLTEALGPLANAFRSKFRKLHCSEFVAEDATPGRRYLRRGKLVRHEDVTRLSFLNESLDHVLTYDVLEHVPEAERALKEFARVLKPGGSLSISVPFILGVEQSIRRASLRNDGTIEHHLEPQYHGDPLSNDGILCFHEFAWDILETIRECGFSSAKGLLFASPQYAYFGPNITIEAIK